MMWSPSTLMLGIVFLLGAMLLTLLVLRLTLFRSSLAAKASKQLIKPSSPVTWISDNVWQTLDLWIDAQRVFLLDKIIVVNPTVIQVTDEDRKRAPRSVMEDKVEVSPRVTGTLAELTLQLTSLMGKALIKQPVWPVCCYGLATLVSSQGGQGDLAIIEKEVGCLDRAFLEGELDSWGTDLDSINRAKSLGWSDILAQMRSGEHNGDAVNFFMCGHCRRYYVASCAPGWG